jgi:hypothetical protein
MESKYEDQIFDFLVGKKLITKSQHAFIKQRSTFMKLLQTTNDWLVSLNSHLCIDVIHIDFAKAFDLIVISKILHKLEYYGISGLLLKWIGLYLHDRTQCVVAEGFSSFSSFQRRTTRLCFGS